jgi:epoxide hydrolase-like predicted phosphatase
MAINTIVFDLAGVLLYPIKGTFNGLLAERLGVSLEAVDKVMGSPQNDLWDMAEMEDDDFYTYLLQELNLPMEKKAILEHFVLYDFYIQPEMLAYIREKRKKYTTVLLTNFPAHVHDFFRTDWNIEGAFDHLVASCDIHLLKPDVRIYQYMLDTVGCQANEAIFIDDREANVKGAEALGIRSIQCHSTQQVITDLEEILQQLESPHINNI